MRLPRELTVDQSIIIEDPDFESNSGDNTNRSYFSNPNIHNVVRRH